MIKYTKYRLSDGMIAQRGETSMSMVETISTIDINEYGLEWGHVEDTFYYPPATGVKTLRPANPSVTLSLDLIADSIDSVTITNIPISSEAQISGTGTPFQKLIIDDGEIIFKTSVAGNKLIKIISFPYLDKEFEINAS